MINYGSRAKSSACTLEGLVRHLPDPDGHVPELVELRHMAKTSRHARRAYARGLIHLHELVHPRMLQADMGGPEEAWSYLTDNWLTASEWLAWWRRMPSHARWRRGHAVCPPRPWINPALTSRRGGMQSRRLP